MTDLREVSLDDKFVLDHGRLVDEGSFAELEKRQSGFRAMLEAAQ